MGFEVRKVPANWIHPHTLDEGGVVVFTPLRGTIFEHDLQEWTTDRDLWDQGKVRCFVSNTDDPLQISTTREKKEDEDGLFEEWADPCPNLEDYMPQWPEEERTHWMLYENGSEGTPVSAPHPSPESLASWLVENNIPTVSQRSIDKILNYSEKFDKNYASVADMDRTATYDQWLAMIKIGQCFDLCSSEEEDGVISWVSGVVDCSLVKKGNNDGSARCNL